MHQLLRVMMKTRLAVVAFVCALLLVILAGHGATRAQSPNRAALVVQVGGVTHTRCVSFDEPEISGYDMLARSGLAITAAFDPMGAAICAIEGTGCPVESCLVCAAPDYWSYWRFSGGQWVYSQLGSGLTTVRHGDIEGWSWGRGSPPSVIGFDEICAPPPPTATSLPPTSTPVPPTPTPPLPEAWFRLDQNPIQAGACTFVRWDVTHAHTAYLDEEAVPLNGSREVCPPTTQNYTLRVIGVHGERSYDMTLGVLPSTPTPTVTPTVTPTPRRTALPVATPVATSTFTPTATLPPIPTATSTSIPTPTLTPTPSPTPTRTPTATPAAATATYSLSASPSADRGPTPDASGYLAFALIAGGLLAGLVWRARRRS